MIQDCLAGSMGARLFVHDRPPVWGQFGLYQTCPKKQKTTSETRGLLRFWYTVSHMQCVILAAGKGTRLRPLTDTIPKPLVQVAGKTLLDHIVGSLPSAVDELIIVTGYLEDKIKEHCGEEFYGRKVTYVHQEEQKGTAHALWLCKDLLRGRFLFMFADDLHGPNDIARATSYTRSMLTLTTDNPERFGIVVRHPDGTLAEMIEKPEHPPSNLASTGVMVLDTHIFEYELKHETNGEFYLTDVIAEYAKDYPIAVVEQHLWIPIGYPEDIQKAEAILSSLNR
jgi:NDP-sugar pyrophosphorylase family protein